jgi:hypothetical protein
LPRSKGQEDEDQSTPNADSASPSSSNVEKSSTKRSGNKKSRRPATATSSSSTTDADGIRPDPRWASELEKLKQMLATQTTNG